MTTVTLLGVDGSRWELNDRTSPVQLANGLGGLHLPPITQRYMKTARRAGQRWKDSVIESRTFTMNIRVGDHQPPIRTGDDWRFLDAVFWKALSTDRLATLVVNGERRLRFRLSGNNDFDYPKDPAILGKATYVVECVADEPEWTGLTQTTTFPFSDVATSQYYGGGPEGALGPPFFISETSKFLTAYVSNPGDLPSYPIWEISGPADGAQVGVSGHILQIPWRLSDGDVVVIDTAAQTIKDPVGVNLWPRMGRALAEMPPIPPGDLVPVAIGLDVPQPGASISITLTARFLRAWGPGHNATLPGQTPVGGGLGRAPLGVSPLGR